MYFWAGKNVIYKELKVIAVYKGKLQVCEHYDNFWIFNSFALNHFGKFELKKCNFFAVEAKCKFNENKVVIAVKIKNARCRVHRKWNTNNSSD